MKRLNEFVKTTVVGGALYLAPIALLLFLLGKVHSLTTRIVAPIAEALELHDIGGMNAARLLAIVALVLICFLAGLLARTTAARRFLDWLQHAILSNVPGLGAVAAFGADATAADASGRERKVVLARIEDAWQLAILVEQIDATHAAVFVPGAPDPKTGSVYMLTADRLKPIDVPVREVMRCIKTFGIGSKMLLAGRL